MVEFATPPTITAMHTPRTNRATRAIVREEIEIRLMETS